MIKGMPKTEYLREWRENHKEEIKEYLREWRQEHKDKVISYILKPVVCECGFECGKGNLKRHKTSKLHENKLLKKLNQPLGESEKENL